MKLIAVRKWLIALALPFLLAAGCSTPADTAQAPHIAGPADSGEPQNRLAGEASPYLRQHADNPIHWYPWGEEAFEKARREDKPIFLSIGYSACHWCHVMEEESFQDPEVAALLNAHYVSILVDREERPDLDSAYMLAANLIGGRGGWPLNVFMTPEGRPFHTSTYLPRESRPNQPGMMDLLPLIADAWQNQRGSIYSTAAQVADVIAQIQAIGPADSLPDAEMVRVGVSSLMAAYDPVYGGFAERPKFPQPHALLFLLRHGAIADDSTAIEMVGNTLTRIRHGGIFDQVGYGVHRYATDRQWLTPHFEKMLYDQALLTLAYVEAFEVTGNPLFERSAREILAYVARDMTAPFAAFYATEDADSEGEEGTFYLWSFDEFTAAVGDDTVVVDLLGVTPEGNFTDEATGVSYPRNILTLPEGFAEFASARGIPERELQQAWKDAQGRLLAARNERERPHRDEKILTDWNGLMIAAYARAGRVLGETEYMTAARNAFTFILENLAGPDGRLNHRYLDGETGIDGLLDDYAFLLWGAVELYEATYDPEVLAAAVSLADSMIAETLDEQDGGFFLTSGRTPTPLARQKLSADTDLPSGNSVAMVQLARLARLTGRTVYEDVAWNVGRAFGTLISAVPESHAHMLTAVQYLSNPSFEVVVVGPSGSGRTREMLERLRTVYLPGMVVLHKDPADDLLGELAEFTRYHTMLNDQPTAYVCQNFACNLPTNDPDVMMSLLHD